MHQFITPTQINLSTARQIKLRAESLGRARSKRERDKFAMEFALGAAAMTATIYGELSPQWNGASSFAFMIGVRGYAHVEKYIADNTKEKQHAKCDAEG